MSRIYRTLVVCAVLLSGLSLAGCKGAYTPQDGDIVFQSSNRCDLVEAIEGITESKYSHCGVVVIRNGNPFVIEAVGPVSEITLERFTQRGRTRTIDVYRLKGSYRSKIPQFVEALRPYLGRPYDFRYRMDDERIYCSELVYKAFRKTYGESLGKPKKLKDMNWKPFVATIKKYEKGPVPLDRPIISPRAIAEAEQVEIVSRGME
jgi:hypothetical protein